MLSIPWLQINLNWKPILKSILEDPEGFIADGGWDFLDAEGGSASEGDGEGTLLLGSTEGVGYIISLIHLAAIIKSS